MYEVIKPIETVYNGYKFRSRLEARWAVFFDALCIKYIYEPDGFELPNGERYLPDFYLPKFDYYAEVKGLNNHLQQDIQKVEAFVKHADTSVIILSEVPYCKDSEAAYFPVFYQVKRRMHNSVQTYLIRHRANFIYWDDGCELCDWSEAPKFYRYNLIRNNNDKLYEEIQPVVKNEDWFTARVANAFLKARQARFEYGETPIA